MVGGESSHDLEFCVESVHDLELNSESVQALELSSESVHDVQLSSESVHGRKHRSGPLCELEPGNPQKLESICTGESRL